MIDNTSAEYAKLKERAMKYKENGFDQEKAESFNCNFTGGALIQKINEFLTEDLLKPVITNIDDWTGIVKEVYLSGDVTTPAIQVPTTDPVNDFKPCNLKGTCWRTYKELLLFKKNYSNKAVDAIENSSNWIINRLNLNNPKKKTVKGLVIGSVQSGKTGNMAGVMAQAADEGWNLFIVLSGTIENLRVQTQDRLLNDLKGATSVGWYGIPSISTDIKWENALSKLTFSEGAKQRYINVCLKNSKRMENLLNWLASDVKTREQIRLIIIDDEADQASINAKAKPVNPTPQESEEWDERTKINKYLTYLFTNKDANGNEVATRFNSINYIAYTATPYANVLNEAESDESTYPSDFVYSLPSSPNYFGPQNIFGLASENVTPLPIVNPVDEKEVKEIIEICKGTSIDIPVELQKSILWFYICFAIQKYRRKIVPVSMLIHASQKQLHHENLAKAIESWIANYNLFDFLADCKLVYDEQTTQFSKKCFVSMMVSYQLPVDDYPSFDEIKNVLVQIKNSDMKKIIIDSSGQPIFNEGVHLCIDNCSHSGVDALNEHIRLLYPSKENQPKFTTGFIVVGGATLSRGLTIEGLVSTYFLRTVKTADTLMQMGRWFGYRVGYELLPRIWMTPKTIDKFTFLAKLDYELRMELLKIQEWGLSPSQVGIKVLSHPLKRFLIITSNTKMKDAETHSSYSATQYQTTMFFNDKDKLQLNLSKTGDYIASLGNEFTGNFVGESSNSHLWKGIDNDKVIDYLKSLEYPTDCSRIINYDKFSEWLTKNNFTKWNVVLKGVKSTNKTIDVGGINLGLSNRSKIKKDFGDGIIRIGALTTTADILLDANDKDPNWTKPKKNKVKDILEVREKVNLDKTPLLVIYVIDKDSQNEKGSVERDNLNAPCDIVGTFVVAPNTKNDNENYVSIPFKSIDVDDVDIDAGV